MKCTCRISTTLSLALLCLLTTQVGASQAQESSATVNSSTISASTSLPPLKEYVYAERNFKIGLPPEWGTRSDHFVPLISSPKDVLNTGEEFPSVKVAVLPLREGLTLKSIGDSVAKEYADFWKIRTDGIQKMGALDVRMMVIDQTLQMTDKKKTHSKMMKMFVIGKSNYYVITAISKVPTYDYHAPLFKQIMESFQPL